MAGLPELPRRHQSGLDGDIDGDILSIVQTEPRPLTVLKYPEQDYLKLIKRDIKRKGWGQKWGKPPKTTMLKLSDYSRI